MKRNKELDCYFENGDKCLFGTEVVTFQNYAGSGPMTRGYAFIKHRRSGDLCVRSWLLHPLSSGTTPQNGDENEPPK